MFGGLASWVVKTLDGLIDEAELVIAGRAAEEDTGVVDLQCGRTVFNDVPAKMRTELWLSSLHREGGAGAAAASQFTSLVQRPLGEEVLAEIDKDTHRTFPGHKRLSSAAGQASMLRVLRAYAALDPEVGYTQGMNFLAGLMLTYLEEADAFGALVLVMKGRGLRELYRPDDGMALLQARLWQLGRLIPPQLAVHLDAAAVLPVLYAPSWFLTCFAADFPLSFAARVMDLVITDCYAAPLMKVAVHIVERCQAALMGSSDMETMVHLLRRQVPRWPRSALHDLLTEALGRPWTARQAAVLAEINGAESVLQAVRRVDAAAAGPAAGASDDAKLPARRPTSGSSSGNGAAGPAEAAASPAAPKLTSLALPPPPGNLRDRVDWERWRPAMPALAAVGGDNLRIEPEIREARLDASLNAALSSYAPSRATQLENRTQQAELPALDLPASAASPRDGKRLAAWTPQSGLQRPPSPFAEHPLEPVGAAVPGGDVAAGTASAGGDTDSAASSHAAAPHWQDEFGSFRAASPAAGNHLPPQLSQPEPHHQQQQRQQGEGAGGGAHSSSGVSLQQGWGSSAESSISELLRGLWPGSAAAGRQAEHHADVGAGLPRSGSPAEFGLWATAPASTPHAGDDPPYAAAGVAGMAGLQPGGAPVELCSPLQSATSKAILLQNAHMQEFLAATQRAGDEQGRLSASAGSTGG